LLLDLVVEEGAVVPSLWRLEIANGFQMAIRRNRIDATFRDNALTELSAMAITIDADTDSNAWNSTLRLSDRFRLTVYDAAYLELAQRRRLPLATLDNALRVAAEAAGIRTLGAA
jgi:predicted nucleic acid-binding protein